MRTFALCMALASVAFGQAQELVGRWRSLKTSRGGIGAMYEFRPDGSAAFMPGAVVEMAYRLEGNDLYLPPATNGATDQKTTLTWMGDNRFRMNGTNTGEEYQRQGAVKDRANPILGEWTTNRQIEGRSVTARFLFLPSGKALLLIPFITHSGDYSVGARRLRASFAGGGTLAGSITIKDGILTLSRSEGRATEFVRY